MECGRNKNINGIMLKRSIVTGMMIVSSLGGVDIAYANDDHIEYDFNVPSLTVDSAINAIAQQSNSPAIFPFDKVRKLRAKPLRGQYTLEDALSEILQGTDLKAHITASGVITVWLPEDKTSNRVSQNASSVDFIETSKDEKMKIKGTNKALLTTASAAIIATTATTNIAQAQTVQDDVIVDEVIVTATKRASTIQDVPFSINAQTAADIERTGAQNLEDIARNVAGLTIQNLGPGQSQVSIRGVSSGQIVRDQPGVKEQVGIYLDESVISLSLFTPDIDLFDLNRVETLRGPQGSLFGSGSVGGTIRYITNQPELGVFEGVAEVNVNTVTDGDVGGHIKGAINVPVGEDLAVRAVGYYTGYAGFIDAVGLNGTTEDDVNDGTRFGGRISAKFEPTDQFSITPRILYQEIETDGFNRQDEFNFLAAPADTGAGQLAPQDVLDTLDEREQFLLLEEGFSDETLIADLLLEFSFGSVDLTSISTYTDRSIEVSRDASALTSSVNVDLGFDPASFILPSNLVDATEFDSFTQELRLASNTDSAFQWLIGGFYNTQDRDYSQRLPTPGFDAFADDVFGAGTSVAVANGFPLNSPFNSDIPFELEQFALFGEASYDVTERLNLAVGGRYYDFDETRDFITGGLFANGDNQTDETSSSGFTPRFLAKYDLTESVTLNAQASQGFRLGGVNDPLNLPLCSPEDEAIFGTFQEYDDETLWNFEGGFKVKKNGFTFNVAGFYNDISDLQVTLDAGSCSSRVVFNVPDAHSVGVEYEVGFTPIDGLDIFFSGSLIESEFDTDVVDGDGNILAGLRDGNRLPSVPEFQTSASATYSFPTSFNDALGFFGGSVQYVGTRFTQPTDQEIGQGLPTATGLPFGAFTGAEDPSDLVDLELDDYFTLNLNAGLEWENISFQIYGTNLFDENALLSFDRERGGRARVGFNVSNPRTFGATARYKF